MMIVNGVMKQFCRVLFFSESYATSQSPCSQGLSGTFSNVEGNHNEKRHI